MRYTLRGLFLLLSKCTEAEMESSSVAARLSSCTDGAIKETRRVAEEGCAALGESAGYCGLLQSSVESLKDSSFQWCHAAVGLTEKRAEEQLNVVQEHRTAVQELLKVKRVVLVNLFHVAHRTTVSRPIPLFQMMVCVCLKWIILFLLEPM